MNVQFILDRTAIALSFLCGIHCIAFPLTAILAPTSLSFGLEDEAFHQLLVWVIVPISVIALATGCRTHKNSKVVLLGVLGLLFLGLAIVLGHDQLGELGEKTLTVLGGILIAISHFYNCRLCQSCDSHQNPATEQ